MSPLKLKLMTAIQSCRIQLFYLIGIQAHLIWLDRPVIYLLFSWKL